MKTAMIAAMLAASLSLPALALAQPPVADTTAAPADAGAPPAADMAQPPADAGMAAPAPGTTQAPMTETAPSGADASMATPTTPTTPGAADAATATPPTGGMTSAPATGEPAKYPVCSRTVKDSCINADAKRKARK